MKKPIMICKECGHTYDDCDCAEDDGTPIRQRGGAREGAGRKPGVGTGRTVTTSSINA
jgi:hypothetical protein